MTLIDFDSRERDRAADHYRAAFGAAAAYDGSEARYRQLIKKLSEFELSAREMAKRHHFLGNLDLWAQRVAALVQQDHEALSVHWLLQLAIDSFGQRLNEGKSAIQSVDTPFCFAPPSTRGLAPNMGLGNGYESPRIDLRTDRLIAALNQSGIYADDIFRYDGTIKPGSMQIQPYNLLQIRRLNREILICDQMGEITFVGTGIRGPLFWATYHKEILERQDGVKTIAAQGEWIPRLIDLLFADNVLRPKRRLSAVRKYPLTEDLILNTGLAHAALYSWELPTDETGEIPDLPGQNWNMWGKAVRQRMRGLTRQKLKGVADLFRLYGLKMGLTTNKQAVQAAWKSLQETGHHGLSPVGETLLTEDLIVNKALAYAALHDWDLPKQESEEIPGLPGQNWVMWSLAVRRCLRGLTRQGLKGTDDLFRLYGLKMGKITNKEAVRVAWETLQKTGHHGLKPVGETLLTEDLLLNKGLEYAAFHDWVLPTAETGEIPDFSGQNWAMWNAAVQRCIRGLTRQGIKGVADLFRLYGLKTRNTTNKEAVRAAWETLQRTGHHGLKPMAFESEESTRPKQADHGSGPPSGTVPGG